MKLPVSYLTGGNIFISYYYRLLVYIVVTDSINIMEDDFDLIPTCAVEYLMTDKNIIHASKYGDRIKILCHNLIFY